MVDSVSRMLLASGSQLDNTPDAFSFTNQINVERSTLTTSNIVTITGIISAFVSVTGGAEININGGGWVSSGTITNNQTLQVRVASSASFNTAVSVTITVGTVNSTWTVTTRAADTTPVAFTFTDVTGIELSTVTTSGTITVSGLEPNFSITVSASGGTVDAGTSSLSGTFASSKTVTTSGSGTLVVAARVTSSASPNTPTNCTVTIGSVSDTFTATTRAADTTPTAFSFTDVTNAEPSTVTTSGTITITGLEPNFSVTISGGSGITVDAGTSSLSGTFASSKTVTSSGSGTIVVAARVTSSASLNTAVSGTITVGSGSTTWTVTTRAADTIPTAFTFTDVTGVEPSTVTPSGTITVSGLEPNFSITVSASGGTVDAGTSSLSGTFASSKTVTTSASGTLVVAARVTSSASFNTQVGCIVTIGGVSDTFNVTTRLSDTTPTAFSFTDVTNVEPSTVTTSGTITVSELEPNISITVSASGGTVDAGTSSLSGTFAASKTVTTSGSGTLVVAARVTSSASFSTPANCTVTIGGVSDTFTATTRAADTTPAAFSFTDQTGVALATTITSGTITVTGLEPNFSVTVSASGGTVDAGTSSLSGVFASSKTVTTSATGTLVVAARVTSSSAFTTAVDCTVTIGGISDTFTATTRGADLVPDTFSFTSSTDVERSTVTTSADTVTVTGLEPNFSVTVSASGGTVDAGTSSLSGTFASSKTVTTSGSGTLVVAARGTSSSSFSTSVQVTVTVGNGAGRTYTITTRAADTTPTAFSFTDVTGVEPSTVTPSGTITVSGLEPNFSITVSASGGTVDAGTSSLSGTFASSKTVTTSGSGQLVVAARVTSSASYSTAANCVVTIGTRSDTFTATTKQVDVTIDNWSNSVDGPIGKLANPNTTVNSDVKTFSGVSPSTTMTITRESGTSTSFRVGTISVGSACTTSQSFTTSSSGTFVFATGTTTGARNFFTYGSSTFRLSSGGVNGTLITSKFSTNPSATLLEAATASFPAGGLRYAGIRFANCGPGTVTISFFTGDGAGVYRGYSFDTITYYTVANATSLSVTDGASFDVWVALQASSTPGQTTTAVATIKHTHTEGEQFYVYTMTNNAT